MIFLIIYIIGWIAAGFVIKEMWSRRDLKVMGKIGLSAFLFFFSWVGVFTYTYIIRGLLDRALEMKQDDYDELDGLQQNDF